MAMPDLKKTATTLTVFVRLIDLAKNLYVGLATPWGIAATSLLVLLYGWAVGYISSIAWWIWLPVALLTSLLVISLYILVKQAWIIRGIKRFDIIEFSKECQDYYKSWAAFAASRVTFRHHHMGGDQGTAHREWEIMVDQSRRAEAQMFEQFGPRAFAIVHQIAILGIPKPNMFHFASGDHGGVGVYIGVVGELLSKGLLDEARKLDPNSTWGQGFR